VIKRLEKPNSMRGSVSLVSAVRFFLNKDRLLFRAIFKITVAIIKLRHG